MENYCEYFGKCGGCLYPDNENNENFEQKIEKIKEYILKTKIDQAPNFFIESVKGKDKFYRNRMDFVFSDNKGPGLRERGKFYKTNEIKQCKISNSKLNHILDEIWNWYNKNDPDVFNILKKTGTLRYSVIRAPEFTNDSTVTFILNKNSNKIEETIEKIKLLNNNESIKNILVGLVKNNTDLSSTFDYEIIKGSEFVTEKLNNITYRFHSQGFFQVNSSMAENMLIHVNNILSNNPKSSLIDLFGGVGTFGLNSYKYYKNIYIIDNNKVNIEGAKHNIAINNLKNVMPKEMDARFIYLFHEEHIKNNDFDLIVDPPRAGLHRKTIAYINKIKPQRVIYISCNPKNIPKDLFALSDNYKLNSTKVFDMFPNTNHVEVIMELILKQNI